MEDTDSEENVNIQPKKQTKHTAPTVKMDGTDQSWPNLDDDIFLCGFQNGVGGAHL
jgi:hypothetical protein